MHMVKVVTLVQLQTPPPSPTHTHLAGGETPRLAEHLSQEGRLHLEVLGHDVEAEEVSVDTLACHGQLVGQGVLVSGLLQQTLPLLFLAHGK